MNAAEYLLEKSRSLNKDFIAGPKETISYKGLCEKTDALAAWIYKNIGKEKKIMLLSENSAFFVIAYLAIIKSGNAAVFAEARISIKDLEHIFSKCPVSLVFAQEKFLPKISEAGSFCKNIFTESILEDLPAVVGKKIDVKSNDGGVALVIFTSGSTGGKKGVMLTHGNIVANTESIIEYLGLSKKDRAEAVLPFFYSYGLSVLNTHLRAGASMVLNRSIFLGSVIDEIKKYGCTGFAGVPSTYQILANRTDFLKHNFPSIRYFTQAGGKLANRYIKDIAEAFPEKLFFVMYGATEATARLSYLPPELLRKKMGSVGKGMPGVKLEVVTASGTRASPGEFGEIVAEGPNIMKGYYRDAEATEAAIKNGKLHTGDIATVDEEGYIYIAGRASNMIKSAGNKVYPAEIEETVSAVKDVLDCAVFGAPDDILGEAPVAAVLAKNPSEELKEKIISFCRKTLPPYKIPRDIVFFSEFPLNSSNKKDLIKIKEWTRKQTANWNIS